MKFHIPDRTYREIVFFARKHQIQTIILFGSRAKGTNTERSDIDLAVSGGDFDGFYWDIQEKMHSLLKFDLVELDAGISEELADELDRYGVIIYEET